MPGGRPKNDDVTIYYDKRDKRWRCQYKIIDKENLKVKRKTKSFKTESEANEFKTTLKYQKENVLYSKNNGIPLNLLIKSNIEKKFELGIIAGNQYNRLNRTLKKIEKWNLATQNIDDLTSDEIQDYMNSLRDYSNSYITKIHELVNGAYNTAQKKGYIVRNPMVDVTRPKSNKDDKEVRALTIEEQQAFTNYLMSMPISLEPYKNVFLFQMFLGLRIGEALALKNTDINLQNNIVSVRRTLTVDENRDVIVGNRTKTYSGKRDIPIPEFIRDSFIEQMKIANNNKDNLLFTSKNDTLVFTNNVNYRLKKILKAMGIEDISSHSLRHTFGTRCIEAGMRAVTVQRLLGHKDISVTLNTYTTVFNRYKEQETAKVNEYYMNNEILKVKQPELLVENNTVNQKEKQILELTKMVETSFAKGLIPVEEYRENIEYLQNLQSNLKDEEKGVIEK